MTDHEGEQFGAITGPVSEGQHRRINSSVKAQGVQGADAKQSPKRKRVDRYPNIVSHDPAGTDLVGFVQIFPPVNLIFYVKFSERRWHSYQGGELGIIFSSQKSDHGKQRKNDEGNCCVAPGAAKRLRKVTRKKLLDARAALRVGLINAAMRANDEAIEIID